MSTLWLKKDAGQNIDQQVTGEQDKIVLSYRVESVPGVRETISDESFFMTNKRITVNKDDVVSLARSYMGTGGEGNQVHVNVCHYRDGGMGPEAKYPLVTFEHETGEALAPITKPEFTVLGYEWLPSQGKRGDFIGIRYLGNAGEQSEREVVGMDANNPIAGQWVPDIELTPCFSAGGLTRPSKIGAVNKEHVITSFVPKGVPLGTDSLSMSLSSGSYFLLNEEAFQVVCQYDKSNHTYIQGEWSGGQDINDNFAIVAVVDVTIKTASGDLELKDVRTGVKSYLLTEHSNGSTILGKKNTEISSSGGGVKFKPKFSVMHNLDVAHRGDFYAAHVRSSVVIGNYHSANTNAGTMQIRETMLRHVRFLGEGLVTKALVKSLYMVPTYDGQSNPTKGLRLTPDSNGFYSITTKPALSELVDIPGTPRVLKASSWLKIGVSSTADDRTAFKYQDGWFKTRSVIGAENVDVTVINEDHPPVGNGVSGLQVSNLYPILKFTNINPTVKNIEITGGNASSFAASTTISRAETLRFSDHPGIFGTTVGNLPQGTTNLPPLNLTTKNHQKIIWLPEANAVTLGRGEGLSVEVAKLPNAADDTFGKVYLVDVKIPYKEE